ncbi:hypothetical protein [Acaryochloris marina]|uniref:Uncharacterized protein n=1 Tax=Acaryochloris marina (strain MBIC 11017) TaxID=329726 RepID=A8ZPX7_ACAM1|nr:hypothetical protein [Acaryochloris marina]ABW33001.1 hypothetical protein AM1_F0184 [Acaryochloris marina MBIC11017]BDM83210.1 hypothetical protein AM10699_60710 [Acaryochloris marina MBIC10699]
MNCIPSLKPQQSELLSIAIKHPNEIINLSYEFPVTGQDEPPSQHPAFIQDLIDENLIQVQVTGLHIQRSKVQQESWSVYCNDIHSPSQKDWELWRKAFTAQRAGSIIPDMTPGAGFEEFSNVWIREIDLQVIQPQKL